MTSPVAPEGRWPGKISLLLSDVDGTLVTKQKVLTPRAQSAVKMLGEAGIAFTVTSSRPPRGLCHLIEPLKLQLPIGGFNGGGLIRPDLTVVEALLLSPEAAREAVKITLKHGLDPWVYTETEWYVRDLGAPHVAREAFTITFPPNEVADFSDMLDHVGKIVAVGDDPAAVLACNRELDATLSGQASATRSQPYFIDITHPDANKGTMVTTMARLLSIPTDEIATIGDMANDLLMFRKSGLSIAMGNATDDVKAQANLVTDTNENDGFAKAVERFLLGIESNAP
jgi:Cof subfamily protein (haloacid dehalogenase superfamily)